MAYDPRTRDGLATYAEGTGTKPGLCPRFATRSALGPTYVQTSNNLRGDPRAKSPAASADDLLFYLCRRTTLRRQRDMGKRRVVRGSMPMLLFGGNVNDIAWRDDLLFRFRRDDALACGHK